MAAGSGGNSSGFVLTPHKLAICMLTHAYASPASASPPFRALPADARRRLALFLLDHSKACDGYLEPTLEELGQQLREAMPDVGGMLVEQLGSHLLLVSSPEELFQFFFSIRGKSIEVEGHDEHFLVEQNSLPGQFLRRCILSFNLLSFEGTCRLVTELDAYHRPALTIARGIPSDKELAVGKLSDREDEGEDGLEDENLHWGGANLEHKLSALPGSVRNTTHELHELADPGHSGGGGVRDGGFAFAFGDAASRGENASKTSFLRTVGQVEGYLKEQAGLIEKEMRQVPMMELDANLCHLEKLAPDMPRTHYLRYLNCLHHGDYLTAMDNLHRYFDFSAGKGGMSSAGASSDASVGRFQAGLLSLGSMHAHFGHVNQAMQALNEAVRIAQQNNDDSCLVHALAALCHLLSEVGAVADSSPKNSYFGNQPSLGMQQQLLLLLRRCLQRALELKLPHLVAFSRLALAKFDLQHVRKSPSFGGLKSAGRQGTSPVEVCKALRLSPYLLSDTVSNSLSLQTGGSGNIATINQQRQTGNTSASFPAQPLSMSGGMTGGGGWSTMGGRLGPLPDSVLRLAGTSHLLRAASWELYGSAPMVRVSALVHAICYTDVASADDLSLSYVKLAQHLAASKGYSAALAALEFARRKFSMVAKSRVRAVQLQLVHDQALHRGKIKLAQVACGELSSLASPALGVDMELKTEAAFRHTRSFLASGHLDEATTSARALFSSCYKANNQLNTGLVLLLLADIHKRAGSAVTGLPYALAGLTLCQSFSLDLLQVTAMVTLAELWLDLGVSHAARALLLLYQCLPIVLGHGSLELRARTNLAVAHCHLSDPSFSVKLKPEEVLEPLHQAAVEYGILEDNALEGECHYLQALVLNALDRKEERDEAAAAFRRCMVALNENQASELAVLPV
ncbi:unnamed protein product [Sphagnum jensenii]|uniref:Anaphase-promoting complex subunit 5 n=1 Tax=Sphagnum jensenii TaxID=128206 RepID=A0ABP0X187_9BRYO